MSDFYKQWELSGRVRFKADAGGVDVYNHGRSIGWAPFLDDSTKSLFEADPSSVKAIIRRKGYYLMIVPKSFTEEDLKEIDRRVNMESHCRLFGISQEEYNSPRHQEQMQRHRESLPPRLREKYYD